MLPPVLRKAASMCVIPVLIYTFRFADRQCNYCTLYLGKVPVCILHVTYVVLVIKCTSCNCVLQANIYPVTEYDVDALTITVVSDISTCGIFVCDL